MQRGILATSVVLLLFVWSACTRGTAQAVPPMPTSTTADATLSVNLLSISAVSGDSPKLVFTFDKDVTAFTDSTYRTVTTAHGVQNPPQASPVVFDQGAPARVSVPFDFVAWADVDSVQISVTLSNIAHPSYLTTPLYTLDLSFLRAIKGYKDQINQLSTKSDNLSSAVKACQTDRSNLINKQSPTHIDNVGKDMVGPTTVVLFLRTDVYGTIQVTETATNTTKQDTGLEHHVKFTNLAPGTAHTFSAVALSISGQVIPNTRTNFSVSTPSFAPFDPKITVSASSPTVMKATINFNSSGKLPDDVKSYVVLHYQQQLPDNTFAAAVDQGDAALDSNGVPKGTPYKETQEFTISAVPGKTYLVTFTAYDDYGDVFDFRAPGVLVAVPDVPKPPEQLRFTDSIAVSLSSSGMAIKWGANRKVQDASLTAKFSDGTSVNPPITKDANGTSMTVTLDVNGIASVLAGSQTINKKTNKPNGPPDLTLTMNDGTGTPAGSASISFSVAFVVPTTKDTAPTGDAAAEKAAVNVASAIQKGKPVDWKALLASGLGAVVKLL